MDYSTLDDEMLIRLMVQAQAAALSELYDRYNRLVFSLALSLVGNRATAEEITLDVFTKLWENAGAYRSEQAKVSTWLINITRHQAIDVLRRQNARPEQYSLSWAETTPASINSNANSPEEMVELSLRQEQIRAAIAQLPADQRQALALAYFNGYTHRQIAEQLGQPLGTIKTRIRLAMQKLRQVLEDEHLVI
jgi:RNA polymerase sigma-70 factor (ECF subfamily)